MCNYSEYVKEKGREEGIQEGETRVKLLLKKLAADIGLEAAFKVVMNPDLQQEYYKKYGI